MEISVSEKDLKALAYVYSTLRVPADVRNSFKFTFRLHSIFIIRHQQAGVFVVIHLLAKPAQPTIELQLKFDDLLIVVIGIAFECT